ncbi:MAG: aspartate kinase [Acidobacteria bacterium]|nr:aspartate kinase [Acidobacteriota bacterium]
MPKPLLVMKFGGTSVGSPEAVRRAAELAAHAAADFRVVVVASAMSKVTDLLLDTLEQGERGDETAVEANLQALLDKHMAASAELVPSERRPAVEARLRELLDRYGRIARGMLLLRERPPRSVDEAVSTGEKLSTVLLAETLEAAGVPAQAVDSAELIVTDDLFGSASPLMEETRAKASARLGPLLADGVLPVATGFNGATAKGVPTTLGRGGSDFSAAILAAALDADQLWIWTDVDGILTGDPRVISDARVLPEVTYNEAAELAYAGAKVLHQRTLAPLIDKEIPVWIKNTFRPERPGTRIGPHAGERMGVRAITSLPKVSLISIEAVSFTQSGAQLMSRALAAAVRAKVDVLMLSRSSFRQNFCMLVRTAEVEAVLESLRDELALELDHGYVHPIEIDHSVGLVAAVGEGMRGTPGLAGRLFTAISQHSINIIAIAQGSSELTIAVVVRQDQLEEAVRAIHSECGLGSAVDVA